MNDIVTISGTSRPDNYTSRALAVVNDELRSENCPVTHFDARELGLNFPGEETTEDAERLIDAVDNASAVVLATPEYHGSFAAMTKLIIENLGFPSALKDKPLALLGVAAGRIGAIKSLEHLRSVCSHTGALVLPNPISVAGVRNSFDEEGNCTDEEVESLLRGLATNTIGFIREYVCPKHELEASVRSGDESWSTAV